MSYYFYVRKYGVRAFWHTFLFIFLIMTFQACQKAKMQDPVESLKQNAETYWSKRFLEKDYDAIYKMEANQESVSKDEHLKLVKNSGQIVYISIATKDARVDGSKGTVDIMVTYSLPSLPKKMTSKLADHWIIKDNVWKHILRKKQKMPSF